MLEVIDHELYSGNKVRELRIYRPPVNAFNAQLLIQLKDSIAGTGQADVGAFVLSGHGGVFSAGLDIKETAQSSRDEVRQTFQALRDVTLALGLSDTPLACAITGNCLGAGAIFSLFCDYRVMRKRRAVFGITEVKGGMTVGNHVIHALARLVGENRAQQMILEARVVQAQEARQLGLVDEVTSPQLVVSRAVAWCDRVLRLPREAMINTRASARAEMRASLRALKSRSIDSQVDAWFSEGVQASLNKLLKT